MSEGGKYSGKEQKRKGRGYVGVEGGCNKLVKVSLAEKGALEQRRGRDEEVRQWGPREEISRQRGDLVLSLEEKHSS